MAQTRIVCPTTARKGEIVEIKTHCRRANIAQIDAGPKGAVVSFRNKTYPNTDGLVRFVTKGEGAVRLQPDGKLIVMADWERPERRLGAVRKLVRRLAELAEGK